MTRMLIQPILLSADQVACVVPSECQKFCGRGTGCSALAYPVLVLGVMPHGKKWTFPPRVPWLPLGRQVRGASRNGFLTSQTITLHVEASCVLGGVSIGSLRPLLPSHTEVHILTEAQPIHI
jgi:hypothetical protein